MLKSIGTNLQSDIMVALSQDPITEECAIEVIDNNGIITLAGVVPSAEASDRAEAIARTMDGVGTVLNQLAVAAHNAR
jgi:osmotically-inducible protein OsmY